MGLAAALLGQQNQGRIFEGVEMDLALETRISHLLRESEAENKTAEQMKAQLNVAGTSNPGAVGKLQALVALHQGRAERLRGEAMAALASRR